MKRLAFVVTVVSLVSTALLAGCSSLGVVVGKGPVVSRDFNVSDFTGVNIATVFDVELVPSQSYNVTITANENIFQYIDVSRSGNMLTVGLKGVSLRGPMTLKARITMPELNELRLSGATRATAYGFKSTQDFKLSISGASSLDMDMETGGFEADLSGACKARGKLKAGDTDIQLSGACAVEFEGSAGNVVVGASGASKADLSKLSVKDADVGVSGGSRASVNTNGRLDVSVSGGSTVEYAGSPVLGNVNVSGGSTVRRK